MFESKSSRVMTSGMMSSLSDEWETPQQLFDILNAEFGFQTDVCATAENAKCAHFYTKDQNGLDQQWSGVCWMNPPYGREIIQWVKKAFETTQQGGGIASLYVCYLPEQTRNGGRTISCKLRRFALSQAVSDSGTLQAPPRSPLRSPCSERQESRPYQGWCCLMVSDEIKMAVVNNGIGDSN